MKTHLLFALSLALLPLTASAITRTWDNGGGTATFSAAENWNPDGAPANGDDLVFPTIAPTTVTNDLAGRTFGSLSFPAGTTPAGNAFTLTGGITVSGTVGGGRSDVTIGANITLGADQTFSSGGVGALTFGGNVSFGARTLMLAGARPLTFQGITGSSTAGSRLVKNSTGLLRLDTSCIFVTAQPFTFSTGTLDVDGFVQTPLIMTGGTLTGEGSIGLGLDASGGDIIPDAGDLDVSGATVLRGSVNLRVALTGPDAETALTCGGAVTLQDQATLEVISTAYTPVRGDGFQVLTKSPAGAITGTFSGLPAGTEIPAGTSHTLISYTGGNGNDVFLTTSSTVHTWDGGATLNDNWDEADNWVNNNAPRFGGTLVFGPGIDATDRGLDNNFPNDTTFRQLIFNGDDFTVRGARFQLSHGIKLAANVTANLDTDVVLAQDQTISFGSGSRLHLDLLDEIETAGRTLSLAGQGTLDGTISGTGGVTVPSGPFGPNDGVLLTARSTYTGTTIIETGGKLRIFKQITGFEGTLGGPEAPTRVSGRLRVSSVNLSPFKVEENLAILSGGHIESASSGAAVELAGDLTLEDAGDASIDISSGKIEISGPIQGNGNLTISAPELNPLSIDPLVIKGSQSNTFTGSLTTSASLILDKSAPGVLAVPCASLIITGEGTSVETRQDEQILDTCHVQLRDGGNLKIGNITARTETIGDLTMQGSNPIVEVNSTLNLGGDVTVLPGAVAFGHLIFSEDDGSLIFKGTPCIMDVADVAVGTGLDLNCAGVTGGRTGAATIRKTGPGTVQWDTVSVPMEIIGGAMNFIGNGSGSPVTLNGGKVTGNGSCGSITSGTGGGRIEPGPIVSATAVLSSGALILNGATVLETEISTTTAGTGYDELSVSGTASLGGAALELQYLPGFNIAVGQSIFPLLNNGTDAIIGTFAGLPQGAFIPIPAANGGGGWIISYTGGTGNDVSLTRVVTPPVEVQPTVTTVTFGAPDGNGNRAVTIAGKGTPGASYKLENSVNLTVWTTEGTAQTANATTGALNFTSSASPPVRLKQFWRFRKL